MTSHPAFLHDVGISTWLVLSVVFLWAYWYLSGRPWKKQPPGPISLPIIGSLLSLDPKDVLGSFKKLSKKYGDVCCLDIGILRCVVLNGYDVIKEALVHGGFTFAGRPNDYLATMISKGSGVIGSQGHLWQQQRRYVLHILRNYGLGKRSMDDLVMSEVEGLLTEMKTKTNRPRNVNNAIIMAVSNVTMRLAFGRRFNNDDSEGQAFIKNLADMAESLGSGNVFVAFPYLRFLPGDLFGFNRLKTQINIIDAECSKWIQTCKDGMNHDASPSNLIEAYLLEMQKQAGTTDSTFSDFQLLRVVTDLFAAGTETTSTTLAWALLYMIVNPDIQNKVQTEIDDVIGSSRLPNINDRRNMPYTEAVLSEVQRLGDIVPLNLPHSPLADTTFREYFLSKGSYIIVNLNSIHSDPQLWPQPDQFDPKHFLDERGQYRKREELVPFSLGKRMCLGEGLARMELFLFFTAMLQQFKFLPPDGATRLSTEGVLGVTRHPKPYDVIIEQRNQSE